MAKMMAAYLRRAKIAPDLVICSTATRAKQTLDPIVKAINPPKVILERKIFGGTQKELWKQLWNIPKSAKSVLLIGHNPALQNLALELAQTEKALPRFRLQGINSPPMQWRVSASVDHGRRWNRMELS